MRIGIDVRSLLEGRMSGVGEYTFRILRALFSADQENQYVLFLNARKDPEADLSWITKYNNVELRRFRYPNKLFNFLLWYLRWPKLDTLLGGVDIFFAPNIQFIPLSSKVRLVMTLHDLSFELYPETFSWKRRLWHVFVSPRKLCRRAHKLVSVSESTADDVRQYYGQSNDSVVTIYNAVADSFQKADRNSERIVQVQEKYHLPYRFILYFGTLEPRKNIRAIVRAYNVLRKEGGKKYDQYALVLAGQHGWKVRSVLREVETSPYHDSIIVTGSIDAEDKPALYTLASVFIYPSLYEGFGFPVLEAMRCGVPVITSNTSSLAEISGDAAILVDPYKPSEIYCSLRDLLEDKDLYNYYVQKGRERTFDFRWQKSAQQLLEVFTSLLKQ